MEHLWTGADGEAKAVHAALGRLRGITVNTIQSTLKRLFEKGLLVRDKVSHAHVYRPAMSREAYHCELLGQLVGDLLREDDGLLVQAFVDLTAQAGPAHLDDLEREVARRRGAP